ncbi:MAG: DEAD/DEAH box helicase, partial [Candidatus Aenigmatarchaeota archaeon]
MNNRQQIYESTYESIESINSDNYLSEKEKIIFSQLLDLCRYIKKYSDENYRDFIKLVTSNNRQPPDFIFSKLRCRRIPIEVRKSKNLHETKINLSELDKKLQENFKWDLKNFGPSFSQFVEKYGISPADFQIRSWEKIFLSDKKIFAITAPTGFGKTECFLLPIIFSLFRQKIDNDRTKQYVAAFIYPRRILIEDQASRVIKAIKILWKLHIEELKNKTRTDILPEQPIVIGLQKAEIPQFFNEQQLEENGILKKDDNGFILQLVKCLHDDGAYNFRLTDEKFHISDSNEKIDLKGMFKCEKCGFKIFISICRENNKKIVEKEIPFILLTTFESLERLFLETEFSKFFKNLRYIVIDEAHVYQSIYGLHISHILKKLFEIIELHNNDLSQLKLIFSSATLPKPTEFIAKLLSFRKVEHTDIENIRPEKGIDFETLNDKYKYFLYLLTKRYNFPMKTYGLIQTVMYFAHVINKIYDGTRTVVFFDTKGSLYRLRNQYNDAENKLLVRYRIRNVHDKDIPQPHNWNLIFDKLNKTVRIDEITQPIPATHVTSEFKEQRGDVMFCTSAFELGVDDPKINTVIQYGSPRSLLNFVQRIGRGNRIREDRFFVSILDSFDPIDAFYFQNSHLLSEEAFEREGINIPETNKIVERIHEILLDLNKEFLSYLSKTPSEKQNINTIILEVFKSILIKKGLCLGGEFKNLIDELIKCSNDEKRSSILSDKIKEAKEDYKNLEEEIKVRNLEEICEQINEFLSELEKKIRENKSLKSRAEEILNSEAFINIKLKLDSLIEFLKQINENFQPQEHEFIRKKSEELIEEVKNNFKLVEEKYKNSLPLYKSLIIIRKEFLSKSLDHISSNIDKYIFNKLNEEEVNRKIREQDSIFLKRIGLMHLKDALFYRKEYQRQATRWEKFIKLLQSCFWFNLSYLVEEDKLFEKYEDLIKTLPYISTSYFEESMEFPVILKYADKQKEGYMVTDVYIKYFPLKVDFEPIKIKDQKKVGPLILDFEKIYKKEIGETTEIIVKPRRGKGYEYIEKREGDRIFNLPLQVPLKIVYEDVFGYVPFCFNCFNISTNEQECEICGRKVSSVKIFGKPIFNFIIKEKSAIKKIGNFILSPIYAFVILEGSENEIISRHYNKTINVNVRLKYPFIFPLFTPSFIVDLSPLFENIKKAYGQEDTEKILHSFTHALLRLVASFTGFSEEIFFYFYDLHNGKIYIFERYQGGIGAIDKFFKVIEE